MRTQSAFLTLIAELDGDAEEIRRLLPQNVRAWERILAGADDVLDWVALGFTIHTLYGVAENYFFRVSKFFEGNLPAERSHRALVERMGLDIPGIRPAFFDDRATKRDAFELLRFRQRMRNLYGEDLDPRRMKEIQEIAARFFKGFPEFHLAFRGKLHALAEHIE